MAETKNPCRAEMVSDKKPGHIHDCMGDHEPGGDHFCSSCKEWWGKKEDGTTR